MDKKELIAIFNKASDIVYEARHRDEILREAGIYFIPEENPCLDIFIQPIRPANMITLNWTWDKEE